MALYSELFELQKNSALRNRVVIAASVKAQSLIDGGAPTAAQITWANDTLISPRSKADQLISYVLAANKGLSELQIRNASDADIQLNVDAAVNSLISGGA